ncbi:MAG: DUF4388 domain-containing protein [Actinobacteria bacterium]|nr:DUF4388 domain-containing protein [Actinomycetota bacterium]
MLKGTLDDFTLPDIFRLLSQSRKTGRLDVQRSAGQGNVYFRDGDVYFAESTLSKELIGQKLVRARVVTDGQLMKALDEQADGGGRLGDVLRAAGLVTEDQLETAVRSQIEDAVFDLLRWDAGEFDWAPGEATEAEVAISVSVENLIMEGSRRLDELAIITRKIPSENAVVEMAPTPPEGAAEINITPTEWRILVLVNGQRSVLDIAEAVGSDIFATMRTLYGLAAAGLVHVPGHIDDDDTPLPPLPPEQPAAAETAPAVEQLDEPAPVDEVDSDEGAVDPTPDAAPMLETLDIADVVDAAPAPDPETYHASAYDPGLAVDDASSDPSPAEPTMAEAGAEAETEAEPAALEATDLPTGDWFDAPAPGDLIEETPSSELIDDTFGSGDDDPAGTPDAGDGSDADPFGSEILGRDATAPEVTPVAEDLDDAFPTPTNGDSSGVYKGDDEAVDKRAAVQELSDLFRQSEVENTPTFLVPRMSSEEVEDEEDDFLAAEPETKHRVEDDEEITRGLISRLIDGVKGL